MKKLLVFFVCAISWGSDLVIQPGQVVPPGDWTMILTAATGYEPGYPGNDKFNWVPALNRTCVWTTMRTTSGATITTETDLTQACYSFAENNWILIHNGQQFHDEQMCAGHNSGAWAVDYATSMMYGPNCYSAAQAFDNVKTPAWRWDFMAQTATAMWTTPGPSISANQMTSYFDPRTHKLVWYSGGGTAATVEYDPNTNLYSFPTTTGTAPTVNTKQNATFYRTVDGKGYIVFGLAGITFSNSVYSYQENTNVWTLVTVAGTPPPTRQDAACAYSPDDDAAICYGGYDTFETPSAPADNLTDTWLLDFNGRVSGCGTVPCWVQLSPATVPTYVLGSTIFQRMAYDTYNKVFLMGLQQIASPQTRHIWAYRFNPGTNAGWNPVSPVVSFPYSPGTLNRDVIGGPPSLAQSISVAANGSDIYYTRQETGGYLATGDGLYRRIYVSKNSGGTPVDLPSPSTANSISPDIAFNTVESNDPTIAVIGGVPYVAWSQWNTSGSHPGDVTVKSFVSNAWTGGAIGWLTGECSAGTAPPGANSCPQHSPKIIGDAGGLPTVAYIQATHITTPYQDVVLVKQFSGGVWNLLGGPLNNGYVNDGTVTNAEAPSIVAGTGTDLWVAWTDRIISFVGSPDSANYTNTKMYLKKWNGTSWVSQCGGTGNVNTTTGWALTPTVTLMGGIPYVAYTERLGVSGGVGNDISRVYVRACNAGVWSTVGSVYLNRDQTMGWAFQPRITNDGTNLWVTWYEQGNGVPWAQTYSLLQTGYGRIAQRVRQFASFWNGTTWTKAGESLSIRPDASTVVRSDITIQGGKPVIAWGETLPGSLRQIYAKQWSGTQWVSVLGVASPLSIVTTSLPNATQTVAYSQTLFATGGTPPYTWTLFSGSLPAGLTLSSAGLISGTVTGTTQTFTVRVTDAAPTNVNQSLTITVNGAPSITTSSLPTGLTGTPYSTTLAKTGGTAPFTWSIFSGALQSGLSLDPSTGIISGTPTVASANSIGFRITDANGAIGNATLTLTINSPGGSSPSTVSGQVVIAGQAIEK